MNSALHTPLHPGSDLRSIHRLSQRSLTRIERITASPTVTSQEGPLKERDKRLQAPPRLSMGDAS